MKKTILSSFISILLIGCSNSSNNSSNRDNPQLISSFENNYNNDKSYEKEEFYHLQWNLKSSNFDKAWDYTKGEGVIVTIIGDSFDINHEDLKGQILETFNVIDNSSDISNDKTFGSPEETASKGTPVSGIIGASQNKKGIVGASSGVKLVLIKSDSNTKNILKSFEIAKNLNSRVILNIMPNDSTKEDKELLPKLKDLYDNGITVVYPASNINSKYIISVGSSNEEDSITKSYDSSNIDIVAPSGDFGVPTIDEQGSYGYNQDQLSKLNNIDYTYYSGDNASASLVTSSAALLISLNPSIKSYQVRKSIIESAKKLNNSNYKKLDTLKAIEYSLRLLPGDRLKFQ